MDDVNFHAYRGLRDRFLIGEVTLGLCTVCWNKAGRLATAAGGVLLRETMNPGPLFCKIPPLWILPWCFDTQPLNMPRCALFFSFFFCRRPEWTYGFEDTGQVLLPGKPRCQILFNNSCDKYLLTRDKTRRHRFKVQSITLDLTPPLCTTLRQYRHTVPQTFFSQPRIHKYAQLMFKPNEASNIFPASQMQPISQTYIGFLGHHSCICNSPL